MTGYISVIRYHESAAILGKGRQLSFSYLQNKKWMYRNGSLLL